MIKTLQLNAADFVLLSHHNKPQVKGKILLSLLNATSYEPLSLSGLVITEKSFWNMEKTKILESRLKFTLAKVPLTTWQVQFESEFTECRKGGTSTETGSVTRRHCAASWYSIPSSFSRPTMMMTQLEW